MFALSTAASLALGGMFWAWALHGGEPAIDPRTAARVFGWLCIMCTGVGLFFTLRGRTPYDRGPALVGALAATLLTGSATLYLSYYRWENPPLGVAADAAPGPLAVTREASAPAIEAPSPKAPWRHKVAAAKASHVAARAEAGPCAGLERLARQQCLRCSAQSGLSRFLCDENARAAYCSGREGSEPGCPWRTSSNTE